jgi:hypothetical protein
MTEELIDLGGLADSSDEHLRNLWVVKFGRDWVLDTEIEKDTFWHALLIGMLQRKLVQGQQRHAQSSASPYKPITTSWKVIDADR